MSGAVRTVTQSASVKRDSREGPSDKLLAIIIIGPQAPSYKRATHS